MCVCVRMHKVRACVHVHMCKGCVSVGVYVHVCVVMSLCTCVYECVYVRVCVHVTRAGTCSSSKNDQNGCSFAQKWAWH